MNLPHIQFYVGDWRKDLGIQTLSYHHRGIWFELLMLMHCSEQRGKLVVAGKPMSNAALARLLGLSQQETQDALAAILDSGVASKTEAGIIFCRRMVREEEMRQNRKRAGSIGGSKRASNIEATPDNDNGNGLEKVREFARGEGIPKSDADWFYWKGHGNGWTNGGKPILDWKATLRSWQRAKYLPSQKNKNGQFQTEFKKPAPTGEAYRPRPPTREISDEEFEKARRVAVEEAAKFRAGLQK
jgi:uncharacterized protein YdaU (DUF1376 family)